MTNKQLCQAIYGCELLSIDWPFFGRVMRLVIGDDPDFRLTLKGVHYCSFRQSLQGPGGDEIGPGCSIYAFAMFEDHPFINSFLNKKIGFPSDIIIYDMSGKRVGSEGAQPLLYAFLVCSAGHLDIVFEAWEMNRGPLTPEAH